MVFFTCNSCGESLKKNKVDQHAMRCYGCQFLTCIDCSEDFWGDDYKLHISCITEDQKYGSSSYKAKPNKGEVKQNEWMAKIQKASSAGGLSAGATRLLQTMVDYENIPRKKKKFLNFMKNSLRVWNEKLCEEVWEAFSAPAAAEKVEVKAEEVIEEKPKPMTEVKENADVASVVRGNKMSKKRKAAVEDTGDDDTDQNKKKKKSVVKKDDTTTEASNFAWKKSIKVCVKNSGGEMSLKKLKKKIFAEYRQLSGGEAASEVKLEEILSAKLAKSKLLNVTKSRVTLK